MEDTSLDQYTHPNKNNTFNDTETREYIESKLREQSFLDAQYLELSSLGYRPQDLKDLTQTQIYKIIIDKNLLEKLIDIQHYNNLSDPNTNKVLTTPKAMHDEALTKNELMIYQRLNSGRCFTDFMSNQNPSIMLQQSISFLNQRFLSKLVPACTDPKFDEAFILKFDRIKDSSISILNNLQNLQSAISFALIRVDKSTYSKEVQSLKEVEWRFQLSHGKLEFNIEFPYIGGGEKGSSCGFLNIFLELLPKKRASDLIDEKRLDEQFTQEKKIHAQRVKNFYEFSSEWWKDYKSINPIFEKRAVKVYAGNELGHYKPVFTYVQPLKLRGIDSPQYAARFISLIPFTRNENIGGEKNDCWKTFHTFLAEAKGDSEDHATLLCSILLGFGLEAYVVVGVSSDGGHYWVMTRENEKIENRSRMRVTYWESLTGQKYDQKDPRVNYLYRKVGSVFNHTHMYANQQEDDTGYKTDFCLENQQQWKSMGNLKNFEFPSIQNIRGLRYTNNANFAEEEEIEYEQKEILTIDRQAEGLVTKFDDDLGYLMSIALSNYESDKQYGISFNHDEFQNALKKKIPLNHEFRAFPIQFTHKNTKTMFETMKRNPNCEKIVKARGDQIHYAIRCKVVNYFEDVFALWVVIGLRYIPI